MNKVAKMWVDALRSGKYIQGTKFLTRIEDGVERDCCLGVLCKVLIENGASIDVQLADSYIDGVTNKIYDGQRYYLPQTVTDLIGMKDSTGWFPNPRAKISDTEGRYTNLAYEQDNKNATFEDLANYIEQYHQELFHEEENVSVSDSGDTVSA